jgi:hypothetical protein
MTKQEFIDLLLTVDPKAKPWRGSGNVNFTVFEPTIMVILEADGSPIETGWRIYINRFTKNPEDPIVSQITDAISGHDEICWQAEETAFEQDTGYFHFIWKCEVI